MKTKGGKIGSESEGGRGILRFAQNDTPWRSETKLDRPAFIGDWRGGAHRNLYFTASIHSKAEGKFL
jgi:hypothetical protein